MTSHPSLSESPPLLRFNSAFLSDFDGTLVELADHPGEVSPAADLPHWVRQLQTCLDDAVAIVTGRRLLDVDRYLQPVHVIGAGAHGAEIRLAMNGQTTPVVEPLDSALAAALESAVRDLDGVWVENKTYALAVHFRQNLPVGAECYARIRSVATSFPQVKVFFGHAVVEVRDSKPSKGTAVEMLLSHPVFAGRIPHFVGDDFADEEAFKVVQAAGGYGVKVGEGETHARYRLPDVSAVHRWVRESLETLRNKA